jgi:hypothetical protein
MECGNNSCITNNKSLSQVELKPTESPFWQGLMWIKEDLFIRGSFEIGDGPTVCF